MESLLTKYILKGINRFLITISISLSEVRLDCGLVVTLLTHRKYALGLPVIQLFTFFRSVCLHW